MILRSQDGHSLTHRVLGYLLPATDHIFLLFTNEPKRGLGFAFAITHCMGGVRGRFFLLHSFRLSFFLLSFFPPRLGLSESYDTRGFSMGRQWDEMGWESVEVKSDILIQQVAFVMDGKT